MKAGKERLEEVRSRVKHLIRTFLVLEVGGKMFSDGTVVPLFDGRVGKGMMEFLVT